MLAGEAAHRRSEWERLAWQTAHILNLASRRTIRPKDLLGPKWDGGRATGFIDRQSKFEVAWKQHLEKQPGTPEEG